jgi:hypothetical protein
MGKAVMDELPEEERFDLAAPHERRIDPTEDPLFGRMVEAETPAAVFSAAHAICGDSEPLSSDTTEPA